MLHRHLAAAEGQVAAVEWLLKSNCTANPVDRFSRTPLDVRPGKAIVERCWFWDRG